MSINNLNISTIKIEQPENDNIYPEASAEFVQTPYIQEVTERALLYLDAGYPVHFAGPAGTGKTTLAFHIAALRKRPVTLIHGNHEFGSSDLIGKESGYRRHRLVDNYVHSVMKEEEELKSLWVDNRLTTCCRNGDTLVYDEFNRSTPEANNVLLSILEEGILNLPSLRSMGDGYLEVHPSFRAIFTSNPQEYAGTHATQDALVDRMITIMLNYPDRDTEVRVAVAKSGISNEEAGFIVDIVNEFRELSNHKSLSSGQKSMPTVRASIAISRVLIQKGEHAFRDNVFFHRVCHDVLCMYIQKISPSNRSFLDKQLEVLIGKFCPAAKSALVPKVVK
ncbi:gas vesicle protein GvpN [Psychromonas ingrahamii 37]|uniref:Gas vesicle protein GvpN n=1 Tax=Psychromonas ingrahamii (strain DSM 17664 / CCUG 51855 / 37) TaxID=357804 RepID=A1SVL9_PSYIN|nr:gas vesicle protein GvpN [Psychromonas ingrahamii]ABM03534.1 gas vesicle protein GvpN [Psychromonas ingrahamii 37]